MYTEEWVPVHTFCESHQVEISFIQSLERCGLVQITTIENSLVLPAAQLDELEKIVRLHAEINIHAEDIDVIVNLLNRISEMQQEIIFLKNKLQFYQQ